MRVGYAILVSVAACGFPRPQDVVDDAMADAADPGPCFGSYLHVCFDFSSDVPTAPQTWADAVVVDIDTDTSALCNQHNDQKSTYCVVASAGMTLDFGKTVRAHGSKPLVLLSTNTMALAGMVDVGSYRAGVPFRGAGANPPGGCTFTTPPFGATIGGGGGGYGGSFGTRGGDGSNSVPMSGSNGRAGDALLGFPPALRGGCRGGDGGAIAGPEGQGGDGGGAVALIAAQIHIDGRIDASGSGGHGGFAGSGGGGGGSGGMVVVDSGTMPSFANTAKLWANGGGGGQGGASGMPGSDGEESNAPNHQGLPGLAGSGATGGGGSVGSGPGMSAGQDTLNGGGGGGGGGAGFIRAPGLTEAFMISPPSFGS